jgi:hypothetical protein
MHPVNNKSRRPGTAVLALVLAGLILTACGSASTSSTKSSKAAATTSAAARPGAPNASRFTALRECLQKHGITLPKRTPGQLRPAGPAGLLGGAGATLPKGVTQAQYQAAVKKCGGIAGARSGGLGRIDSPPFKRALAKFATCMRENGVKLAAPNTSGKGAIFNSKGLNTNSSQFKTAETKCSASLRGALRPPGPPGVPGAPRTPAG